MLGEAASEPRRRIEGASPGCVRRKSHNDGPIDVYKKECPASRPDLHVFGEIYADLGVPQCSSLGPSLDRAEDSDINRPLIYCAISWGENSYLRLEKRRSPGTKGRGDAACGGQIYSGHIRSGPVSSVVKVGTGRQGCSGWALASRHTYGSRVQPKLARTRRPTNEAMDIRKKDWQA